MRHITLTLGDFQQLVRGQVVEHDGVALILEDAGFPRLVKSVLDAAHGLDSGAERATVPSSWVAWSGGRMDPNLWLFASPRAYDLMAQGEEEEDAVRQAVKEYRENVLPG